MRILFNASNVAATGPTVLLKQMVPAIAQMDPSSKFHLLLPTSARVSDWSLPSNVTCEQIYRASIPEISRLWDLHIRLPHIARAGNYDAVVTLGDLGPIHLPMPHLIYLHQPYYVYSVPELSTALSSPQRLKLWYQRRHFCRSVQYACKLLVQTPVVGQRAMVACDIPESKVVVVRPSLPFDVSKLRADPARSFPLLGGYEGKKLTLLFLAAHYGHKNHIILPSVAEEIRRRALQDGVHIFVTLDGSRSSAEKALLQRLGQYPDVITNLGILTHAASIDALGSAGALFLPTLVETLGLPYLEAMVLQKPILTSDLDFAHYVCGQEALYFDPHNARSIVDKIEELMADYSKWKQHVKMGAAEQLAVVSQNVDDMAREFNAQITAAVLGK